MKISFAFFGSSPFSVAVLNTLARENKLPALIVASPDKPQGRHMVLTPPVTKIWAEKHHIPVLQPQKIDPDFNLQLSAFDLEFFVVASYGKILPNSLLSLPRLGVLNVHPSLLPKYRGASPFRSQILSDDRDTGVSIILLDEEVDHGPILGSQQVPIAPWPPKASALEATLGEAGGKLLAEMLPDFILGKLKPIPQEHAKATFTKKISKEDGLLNLADDPYRNFLKIQALEGWPGTYFFAEKKGKRIRVVVKEAIYQDEKLSIIRVVPEGSGEMSYDEFLRGLR